MGRLKIIFLVLLASVITLAQEKPLAVNDSEWVRIESPSKDLSFSLPLNGYLVDNEDGAFRLYYSNGNVLATVIINKKNNAKAEFRELVKYTKVEEKFKYFESGDFLIRQATTENDKKEIDSLWLYLASSKASYYISVSSKDDLGAGFKRFLRSIKLNQRALFMASDQYSVERQTIIVSSLKSDAIVINALKKPDSKQWKLEKGTVQAEDKKSKDIIYSRDLVILRKPRSIYPDSARMNDVYGTVRLRVTFLANGEIGNIILLSSLDNGFDKSSFEAAKRIKFLPAEVDGKAVEVSKTFEYAFSIY